MDPNVFTMEIEHAYPVLLIPKESTKLETNCDIRDNVLINVNILSPDTEGNDSCVYSGFCNIKLIDCDDVKIQFTMKPPEPSDIDSDDSIPLIMADEVWIDPVRSPFVYNHYDMSESQECYSVCHQTGTNITVQQHNTYNIAFNYQEAIHYSTSEGLNNKLMVQTAEQQNLYEYLTGINENQQETNEENRLFSLESESSALKQLLSPHIQSVPKQRKTILFSGPDSKCGQTIQQIAFYDSNVECSGGPGVVNEVVIEETDPPRHKRYQCAKCQQLFDHIADFRDHMIKHGHKFPRYRPKTSRSSSTDSADVKYSCGECGKVLKSLEKFEKHCQGHGDPDFECNRCHKVFASKTTLRTHRKTHSKKYPCPYCSRTFYKAEEIHVHAAKAHHLFLCGLCDFECHKYSDLTSHKEVHEKESNVPEFPESLLEGVMDEDGNIEHDPDWKIEDASIDSSEDDQRSYEIQQADSVIAKVMSNKMFLAGKTRRNKKSKKVCDVCRKPFDRISDLKRHLIEHVVRSTLAKTPVTRSGTFTIVCEVCQRETFHKIDHYKSHLREHAHLTLYQCTFCNKSFSDSSNFSKHKKIHGSTYFQCDLCKRKFNSKKSLLKHMEYHSKNKPKPCLYCEKEFHFESMLNKHIKTSHVQEITCAYKYRCRFCLKYMKCVKDKWDHEWHIHKVRKMVVDCNICGAKFRKFLELKRHCSQKHGVDLPTAKRLLNRRR